MTTRLLLYNSALMLCGERSLSSLSENREPRRLLDHVWSNGGVRACLESGQWKFAMRGRMIDYDPSITPEFGYIHAFAKPSDWCATSSLCSDENLSSPLTQYNDEAGYWYSDLDTIYVRYVSDDSLFGGDLSLWPSRFTDYAAAHFAAKIILALTSDVNKEKAVLGIEQRNLSIARNHDAMADPTRFLPMGAWNAARSGGFTRRDRGKRGILIG